MLELIFDILIVADSAARQGDLLHISRLKKVSKFMKRELFYFTFSLLMCLTLPLPAMAQVVDIPEPVPPPSTVRKAFELDTFYQQWIDVEGLPVVGSAKVNPYALKEAAWLIRQMIGHRPEVLQALVLPKMRFTVIGYTELLTDIPEYHDQGPDFLTYRYRGIGGSGLSGRPAVSSSGVRSAELSDVSRVARVGSIVSKIWRPNQRWRRQLGGLEAVSSELASKPKGIKNCWIPHEARLHERHPRGGLSV